MRTWGALGIAALALSACTSVGQSGPPAAIDQPTSGQKLATSLVAVIDQELARSDVTPEVRGILERAKESGEVSSKDYEDAFARYASCVKAAGLKEDYTKQATGLYRVMPHYSTESEDAAKRDADTSTACGLRYVAAVEVIYNLQLNNPDLLADPHEVAARCLVKAGAVPSDFTGERFRDVADKNFDGAPFDIADPHVVACLSSSGMAVAKAAS